MAKLGMLLGAGVGYVLGTRAGRERYHQIQQQAQRLWKDPRVQQRKKQAGGAAKEKGSQLQDKASEKVAEMRSDSPTSTSASTPAATSTSTPPSPVDVPPSTGTGSGTGSAGGSGVGGSNG